MMTLDEYIANYDKYEDKVADISKKVALKQPLTDEEKELRQLEKERAQETKNFRNEHPEGLYDWINK